MSACGHRWGTLDVCTKPAGHDGNHVGADATWPPEDHVPARQAPGLDAALEVLRPFARLGAFYGRRGRRSETIVAIMPSDGPNVSLQTADCLAALEFWHSHRPGEEP